MFDLTQYTKVYVPSLTNSPEEITIVDNANYPIKILNNHIGLTKDGKHSIHAPNPVLFPYSKEWYNKLKTVYPNLKPYEPDYRSVIKSILANAKTVVCKKSSISHNEAIKNNTLVFVDVDTELFKDTYYVAVNPFTLEVCESDTDYFTMPNINIPF